ncbi:hypothetical protein [Elizabethkingia anophelis]|uniref:helix-turn-helix transcriptional regulator n=1 Tax=Elizabethkingia anophelis TaxID=1117645 RepID=UPI00301C0BD1
MLFRLLFVISLCFNLFACSQSDALLLNSSGYYNITRDESVLWNKKIITIYRELRNVSRELVVIREYNGLSERIDRKEKNITTISLDNKTLEANKKEKRPSKKRNYYVIGISIFLFLIEKIIIYKRFRDRIILKEYFLLKKESENKELIKRVNNEFDNIIDLAKKNHSNFYTRFQEYYPSFQSKLLERNPGLQTSELSLLAYIYLDFQTKEIADYTFKSTKTIQNRKHLLRKKLNILPDEDFYVWLKNLVV